MAAHLRHYTPARAVADAFDTVPWVGAVEYFGIHMESAESGDEAQLFGTAGVHGAVFAVGVDGVFAGAAWNGAEG